MTIMAATMTIVSGLHGMTIFKWAERNVVKSRGGLRPSDTADGDFVRQGAY